MRSCMHSWYGLSQKSPNGENTRPKLTVAEHKPRAGKARKKATAFRPRIRCREMERSGLTQMYVCRAIPKLQAGSTARKRVGFCSKAMPQAVSSDLKTRSQKTTPPPHHHPPLPPPGSPHSKKQTPCHLNIMRFHSRFTPKVLLAPHKRPKPRQPSALTGATIANEPSMKTTIELDDDLLRTA